MVLKNNFFSLWFAIFFGLFTLKQPKTRATLFIEEFPNFQGYENTINGFPELTNQELDMDDIWYCAGADYAQAGYKGIERFAIPLYQSIRDLQENDWLRDSDFFKIQFVENLLQLHKEVALMCDQGYAHSWPVSSKISRLLEVLANSLCAIKIDANQSLSDDTVLNFLLCMADVVVQRCQSLMHYS